MNFLVAKKEDVSFIMAHRKLRVRPSGGSLQNEATIDFSLLRVTIKFISGVYAKNIRTCTLFKDDPLEHRFVSQKQESFFVKWPKQRVDVWRSHWCSEFGGASRLQWVLRAVISFKS